LEKLSRRVVSLADITSLMNGSAAETDEAWANIRALPVSIALINLDLFISLQLSILSWSCRRVCGGARQLLFYLAELG
jgi:hypothetical protein